MKVLVVGGGISDEREVSLRSAKCVFEAAQKLDYQVSFYDWDGQETWLDQNLATYDIVLPILHGQGGEDGQIQRILEKHNKKYLGTDAKSSSICIDKSKTQEILKQHKILVPDYRVFNYDQYIHSELSLARHVVKPLDGGSSLSTFIDVRRYDERAQQIEKAFKTYGQMMVEQFVDGTEVTVPILDGKKLPLIEIIPPEGEFFDYNNKYNGQTKELCPSPKVPSEIQSQAQDIAHKVHKILGCRHISRVDMIIDTRNRIYVLETNTMPGLTDASLFPKAAKEAGMEMPQLVDYLVTLVAEQ